MKKLIPVVAIIFMIFLSSCWDSFDQQSNYSSYKPILMEKSILEKSISAQNARQMCATGKIYFKDNFIYIVERYEGIHVIDNSNPQEPHNVGFIGVPGSVDMAMKNNIIYVDNATDLVAIDISNGISGIEVTKRVANVFPEHLPPDGLWLKEEFQPQNRPENTVIIGWELY